MRILAFVIIALGAIASLVMLVLKRIWNKDVEDRKAVENTDMTDPSSITNTFDNLNRCLIVVALLLLSGCARVILHPIEQIDILRVETGQTYEAPKDGYFLSDFYIKEVMQAKIRE